MKAKRYFLSIVFLVCVLLAFAGCWKKAAPTAAKAPEVAPTPSTAETAAIPSAITPPVPPDVEEPAQAEPSEPATPPESFIAAERDFTAGRYKQASESYEKFLRTFPQASNRDRALFRLGLSLALAGEDQDMRQTEAAFQKLVAEFPRSPYRRQAEWILGLQTRIEKMQSDIKDRDERIRQLGDELRKLKSIDLGRRPSRPE